MNERLIVSEPGISFKDYLFKDKRNRTILILTGAVLMIQLSIFKYYYPTASFIYGDSYSYIKAAYYNLDINTYMIGYSRFLRLFSVFTQSDTALITLTYLLIQGSALFLLFTLYYFYRPGKFVQNALLCFAIFSPLSLHLANLISSDGFFLAVSLIWFTLLIWTINAPSKRVIVAHAIFLFIAFTVRYNALIYPFVSIIAFVIAELPLRRKIIGIGPGLLLCALFIFYTSYKYKQLTGYWQYSPFSGWQLANNAMYTYRYVDKADRKSLPKKFQVLDNMITGYFDSTRDVKKHPEETLEASTIYMWDPRTPLWKFRDSVWFKKQPNVQEDQRWATIGPFFKEYGTLIIKKYPWQFAKHFVWPNAKRYYACSLEFLETYNMGRSAVAPLQQSWFNYKTPMIYTRFKSNKVLILRFYPFFFALVNVAMVCSIICFITLRGYNQKTNFRFGVLLGEIVWALNAGFTIFASSAALRFQAFPLLITTIFSVFLLEWIWKVAFSKEVAVNQLNSKENILQNVVA